MQRSLARTAGAAAEARLPAFSSFTTVVDLDPALTLAESLSAEGGLKCATCSFGPFVRSVQQLDSYDGLTALAGTFRELPRIVAAFQSGNTQAVQELAHAIGVSRCYEIVPPQMPARTSLPRVYTSDQGFHVPRTLGEQDWLLVPLSALLDRGAKGKVTLAHPPERMLIGYVEHALAIEDFADAMETGSLEAFGALLHELHTRGVARAGFIAAVTPCSSLRWRANAPLEALRARLDLAFRRVDADASLMCPENVSGYALSNDLERVPKQVLPPVATRAIRIDRLLFVVSP